MAIQNTVSIHIACQGNALSAAVYSGTHIAFDFDEFFGGLKSYSATSVPRGWGLLPRGTG